MTPNRADDFGPLRWLLDSLEGNDGWVQLSPETVALLARLLREHADFVRSREDGE